MNADTHRLDHIAENIIECADQWANIFASGFLEKVYEHKPAIQVAIARLAGVQEQSINVLHNGQIASNYLAHLLVEYSLATELEATRSLDHGHVAQCLYYLYATGLKLCLLINRQQGKIEVKRILNTLCR